jgi:hypothetical protein
MQNIRDLINENGFDEILIQLFGYICDIHGHACANIDPLKQQSQMLHEYIRSINGYEIKLYLNSLNKACELCQSSRTLLNLNKNKYDHIQIFATIRNSLARFYDNLKVF